MPFKTYWDILIKLSTYEQSECKTCNSLLCTVINEQQVLFYSFTNSVSLTLKVKHSVLSVNSKWWTALR